MQFTALYRNGELVDTYTTDENGYFKTKEYVCGNYTVQEISPSEGYLLDETVYSVGAEAENYSIEHNPLSMTVTEDVLKGNISIIKHSDDGSTQIETPEVGAEFEVYLKSSGSMELQMTAKKTTSYAMKTAMHRLKCSLTESMSFIKLRVWKIPNRWRTLKSISAKTKKNISICSMTQ